ncbi:MAG: serine--tRNA ligase [Gammaproteobacteria bacterium]|nr:serine--tRNA ligase [Gammaproteobacteria bacterium]MDE0612278.1 serine--tRNA ligase [Gammaproteobacteria bacterium]
MLDPKVLRADPRAVADNLARRGFTFDAAMYAELEAERKAAQSEAESLQAQRNTLSKRIGEARQQGEDATEMMAEVTGLGEQLEHRQAALASIRQRLDAWLIGMPNLLDPEVPDGKSPQDNLELRRWGEPVEFDFEPLDHVQLSEHWGLLDMRQAAAMSGARFSVLQGELALLHRALTQFMLDLHTRQHGYEECYVPYLVNAASLEGTGQLPKFRADLFALDGEQHFLIPTAEVPLTNLLRDTILEASELPWKKIAHTPCFRAEAGSYGMDTRGLIRQHQFEKVELVLAVHPEESESALEELTIHAEAVLQALELPYRVVSLCGGDIGFAAARTYDLEVWLPSQKAYREISSCSNFRDFQARRIKARFRPDQEKSPQPVHTLNGSGLAVGRTLVAVLENHQSEDGSVQIPDCLAPWMNGVTRLGVAE